MPPSAEAAKGSSLAPPPVESRVGARWLQHAAVGVVCGIIGVIFALSYAALVFSGPLASAIGVGMGMMLVACAVLALVTAALTTYAPMYAQVRETPIAYLALMVPAVATPLLDTAAAVPTVVVLIVVCTLLLGVVFFLAGTLRLADFVRFIPFPVMSGFLAGVAWLVLAGGLAILTGEPFDLGRIGDLFDGGTVGKLACAVGFMVVAATLTRFLRSGLVLPILVVSAVILFNIVVAVGGIERTDLQALGWIADLQDSAQLWPPIALADFGLVDWGAILQQAPALAAIIPVAMIALLLNISGLELDVRRDIDLDAEMRTAGIANILAGVVGGAPGYQSLSMTVLSRNLGGGGRLTAVVAGLTLISALFFARPLLNVVPLPVFAGLILVTGATLLRERLFLSYRRLTLQEYLIVLGIFAVTVWQGFLTGVLFGAVAAMALFIFDYSRLGVVKLELTGREYQSNAETSDSRRRLLQEHGHAILIMRLQGFLFFGTANGFQRAISRRIASAAPGRTIRFLLLDFRLVTGMDSAAVQSFVRLAESAQKNGVSVIVAHLSPEVARTLGRGGLQAGDGAIRITDTIDRGLADCERIILAEVDPNLADARPRPIAEQLAVFADNEFHAVTMAGYLEQIDLADGGVLIEQDTPSTDIFFIESGLASVRIRNEPEDIDLATMGPGAIVGEISFYLGKPRTAAVVARGPVMAWRFTRESLARLQDEFPETAARFHAGMAAMLADRLASTNRIVRFLAE